MHFSDQRTGGVKYAEQAPSGLFLNRLCDPVGAEYHGRTIRHFVELIDKYGAEFTQAVDHIFIVHHLVAHVDRRAKQRHRALDDIDRTIDTGTETTRIGEQDMHQALRLESRNASSSRQPAPTVMAESAILKAGK